MKERFQRYKFRLDKTPEDGARIVLFSNSATGLELKVLNTDSEEVNSTLCEIEGYYEGDNKPNRVLYNQPIIDSNYSNDVNRDLAEYDAILVIDTSYELISSVKEAFTCIMIFSKLSNEDDTYNYKRISQIVEWDATTIEKPENYMYVQAIERVRLHNLKLNQNPKMAVIIDSDLDNIPSFNNRTKPIFDDYLLPEGFTLFYASSDRGNEYLPNKLLKMCDKEAKEALKEYKKGGTPHVI